MVKPSLVILLALFAAKGAQPGEVEVSVAPSEEETAAQLKEEWLAQKPFSKDPVSDAIGLACMGFVMVLGNAGGISGAGINMPFLLIFLKLEVKQAIPVTAFIATVSCFGKFLLNFKKRHPNNPDRVLVNYEVVLVTMPAVFVGSLIGVMLNQIINAYVQISLFTLAVMWSAWETVKRARKLLQQEKAAEEKK